MLKLATLALSLSLPLALSLPAEAGEYKCKNGSVEKSGSTKYSVKRQGSTITIEKSGSTKGKAVERAGKYHVEVSGSTKATIDKGTIYKSGSSWAKVSDAQRIYDCDGTVAATLWVLDKLGKL